MSIDHGSCHCGEVEFDLEMEERAHVLCHCNTCKTLSGGACSLNQFVPKENLKITKGNLKCYTYEGDSGKKVDIYFCPNCATHIYLYQALKPDKIIARTITLENGKDLPASVEIYGKDRLPWAKEVAHTFHANTPM